MNIYTGLLFQQGYIQDPKLALSLAGAAPEKPATPPERRPPASAESKSRRSQRLNAFRRGGIASVCSVALSPFR
jgi:hypothetical protein